MYLEPWMLFVLALTYGICAWWNHTKGIKNGIISVLTGLEYDKIISISDEGVIKPYRNYDVMIKKRRPHINKGE
jgi:hypothetical protein